MKALRIFIISFLFTATAFAQVKDSAQSLLTKMEVMKQVGDTAKIAWKSGGTINLSGQQVSLTNWAAGGQSAISANGILSIFVNYSKNKIVWSNNLDLAYGVIKQSSQRKWWKNDDRLQIGRAHV